MTASVTRDQRHTRAHPCPLCGGFDEMDRGQDKRCNGFTNGKWVRCSRLYSPRKEETGAYTHCLEGICECGERHDGKIVVGNREPEATYPYHDAHGKILFEVLRFPGKEFRQRHQDVDGRWIWKRPALEGQLPLYRLPEVLKATGTIYVVEGEKDVETLRSRGLTATCNPDGAGKAKRCDWKPLLGRTVTIVVIADADDVGRDHARAIGRILGVAPVECSRGKDVTDHLAAGGTLDELTPIEPKTEVKEKPKIVALAPPSALPEIKIDVDIERMTDQAIAALAPHVYQRSGSLVGVVQISEGPDQESNGIKRPSGSKIISTLEKPTVKERMSSVSVFLKYDGRADRHKPSTPPDDVVSALICRKQWQGCRPLIGVVTAPQLRPDGTVLQEPGYDAATGLLYEPSQVFPHVSDRPGMQDARGAMDLLHEVVCDFPFAKPECESAWIAGLLTMFARPAIAGPVPMFVVDATTRGTGKGRLVNAAAVIATGLAASVTPLPEKDDEMRKRILAIVQDADPMVCLDNIFRPIVMPSLDALLTSTSWKDRLLGATKTLAAPHRTTWWATGNNIILGGDLSRRCLHIRLETPLENPEERTGFKHEPLLPWVESMRHVLVASCLTILRAYVLSGAKYTGRLWGSFEDWSRLVAGAVTWAGGVDPLDARATITAVDEDKMALSVLIEGLDRLCPKTPSGAPVAMSVKAIIGALYPDRDPRDPVEPDGFDDLREAIETQTGSSSGRKPDAKRLGRWLLRVRGRIVGRRAIDLGPNDRLHTRTWLVADR